ncbi:MAG: family 78 glycoside hydrolase catalytic domain, partial [Candidatus Dormibacteraeota bacterium]|nr:family 78 glycoside hydrolase catalytic domain [Candidatus Dormibacteraeota bacterium]
MRVTAPRFEHLVDALGIGVARPRLSWATETDREGWLQSAYQVEVTREAGASVASVWVEDGDSVLRPWPFPPLASRERVAVRVRVRGADAETSPWSEPSPVEAGLLAEGDWSARMISPAWEEDTSTSPPAPLVRRAFSLRDGIARARLYVSAHGVYEIHLNGTAVGEDVLQPGWTSYHHRLRYATHDVTDLVRAGENVAGALLGDGWFRGNLPAGRNLYGERLGLLLQLEVTYLDGSVERVVSDTAWRAAVGPILASDLYNGETYDARREQPGWDQPGFDDGAWTSVEAVAFDPAVLVAPTGPPARRTELVRPVAVTTSPGGRTLVDFGQNLVGRVRLTVSGEPGTEITLRHAEVLEGGELATRPLRSARATDRYTLRGEGPETWEPRFTFHGFRYAEVSGWPGPAGPADVVAVVLGSDLERTGWFECSHPLVERLHENVVWSLRGNTVEIPTDCPQRDERLGWTGDIQVFAPTAAFLYDVGGFLESWLADLAAEQAERGGVVPWVVPDALRGSPTAAAVWGDASVGVPWVLYQRLGDRGLLERQFTSMRAWVDAVAALTGPSGLWDRGFQFGDWLDPAAPPDKPGAARTDPHLIATAYLAHSAHLVALAADTLGEPEVATRYGDLARRTREAFRAEYVTPAGRLVSDAATAYAVALCFDLLPGVSGRRHAAERLATLVRDGGHRIATGFVGTPLI